jgi:GNAT superfamily N-acetyltransferase
MEIRLLRASDDRSSFGSGSSDLDRFLHKYAGQNQFRHHIGVTWVAVDAGRILGYATVAPGHIEIEDLPAKLRRKLPEYPLPILRLARLAVDATAQGQGLGKVLLRFVLQLALRMAEDYGRAGVVVDAKAEAVAFYRGLGFEELEALEGLSESRPRPRVLFLSTRDIRAAIGIQRGSPSRHSYR